MFEEFTGDNPGPGAVLRISEYAIYTVHGAVGLIDTARPMEDRMVDSIAKGVRSHESMDAQFAELDRRLAALDDAAEGEKANKPRRSRRKKNADASVAPRRGRQAHPAGLAS